MRFINRLGPAVCAAAAAVLLTACSGSAASDAGQVGQALGLDLPAVSSISYEDTHGGFHGDGETFAVLTFEGEAAQQMQALLPAQGWRALPMDGRFAGSLRTAASRTASSYGDGDIARYAGRAARWKTAGTGSATGTSEKTQTRTATDGLLGPRLR